MSNCPRCKKNNIYFDGTVNVCPDCDYEWNSSEETSTIPIAKDSNGTELANGDSVIVIKSLKVKGSTLVIKQGYKVKNIRLTDNLDEVDCKIEGSSIVLKTCFLRKQ